MGGCVGEKVGCGGPASGFVAIWVVTVFWSFEYWSVLATLHQGAAA